jgi:hypothetical protein
MLFFERIVEISTTKAIEIGEGAAAAPSLPFVFH